MKKNSCILQKDLQNAKIKVIKGLKIRGFASAQSLQFIKYKTLNRRC